MPLLDQSCIQSHGAAEVTASLCVFPVLYLGDIFPDVQCSCCCHTLQVISASLGPLLRFGTGALASGYKAEFVADDAASSGSYTLATVGGRRIKETSKVSSNLK